MRIASWSAVALIAGATTLMAIPAAAQEGGCTYTGATTWNVKESFNNYLEGFIANGPQYQYSGGIAIRDGIITSGEKASRSFQWPLVAVAGNSIKHGGGIHYTGHNKYEGEIAAEAPDYFSLDNDFSNLTVEIAADQGRLLADYVSREFVDTSTVADIGSGTQVELATIAFDSPVNLRQNGSVTAIGKTQLTTSGETVFGGFYEAGSELADVELDLQISGCGSDPEESGESTVSTPGKPTEQPAASGSSTDDAEASVTQVLNIGTLLGMGGLVLAILGYIAQSAQSWML